MPRWRDGVHLPGRRPAPLHRGGRDKVRHAAVSCLSSQRPACDPPVPTQGSAHHRRSIHVRWYRHVAVSGGDWAGGNEEVHVCVRVRVRWNSFLLSESTLCQFLEKPASKRQSLTSKSARSNEGERRTGGYVLTQWGLSLGCRGDMKRGTVHPGWDLGYNKEIPVKYQG